MPNDKNSASKNSGFLTPNQQWLALSLLAILGIIAVFYFGIGGIGGRQSG